MLAVMDGAKAGDREGPQVFAISADSAQLLGEIKSRQRTYCPITGLERSPSAASFNVRIMLLPTALYCVLFIPS